jgi:hypothetical protein
MTNYERLLEATKVNDFWIFGWDIFSTLDLTRVMMPDTTQLELL